MVIFLLIVIAVGVLLLSEVGRELLGLCFVFALALVLLAIGGAILVAVLFGVWFLAQTLRGGVSLPPDRDLKSLAALNDAARLRA